jgi:kynureninase
MFHFPQQQSEPVHYFCGHSLGLQPLATKQYVNAELEKWAVQGVEGHFKEPNPWLSYHTLLKPGLAYLCGAKETEVVGYGSLSSNLHFLLASFYRPTKRKWKILTEETNFPSDRFALESHVGFRGISSKEALLWIPKDEHYCYHTEQIIGLIRQHREELALVFLSSVNFLSGQVLDIPAIVKVAKEYNILVGLDLAHAIGNTPLRLHEEGVDFAVWCSYKYLNGGPGAVGGYFVHEQHFPKGEKEIPILAGWWGNKEDSRFLMGNEFSPIANADAWQHSNANVLSLAAIRASLDIFLKEDISVLHQKSLKQTDKACDSLNSNQKCLLLTPKNERGHMLSIQLKEENHGLLSKLKEKRIWVDWREPRIVRFSFNPLYNTEKEWEQFLVELEKVL